MVLMISGKNMIVFYTLDCIVQKLMTLHCLKKVLFDGSATIKEAQIEEIYFIIKFQSIPSYTEEENTFALIIDKIIEHHLKGVNPNGCAGCGVCVTRFAGSYITGAETGC